ncbi:MAG: hypothetical protein A2076_05185 [Geobacteraceae bacterium GWC2_53_11]|nr:MAG: hypothetical protein A2076_05185 [Geobacteraceae bacterium GWC2_53_11]
MNMNRLIIILTNLLIAAGMLQLGGCGGGSGGGSAPPSTSVSGIASKGPLKNGTVIIYGVDAAGTKSSSPLATVQTDANGGYSANLGSYSGALVIEAYGDYTDEATGNTVVIPANAPLRTAVVLVDTSVNNNRKIAVTPLTSLACGIMGTTYTTTAITTANGRVGDMFKVKDIVGTLPVLPDMTGMGKGDAEQKTYTMALVTLSQMAKDATGGIGPSYSQIQTIMDSFKADMNTSSTSGLGSQNMAAFNTALMTVSTAMLPGFDMAAAQLRNAGTTSLKLAVDAAGVPNGSQLGAVHGVITVPVGVSMRTYATAQVLDGLISTTPGISAGSPQIIGKFDSTTRQLTFDVISPAAGFGNGEFAGIIFDVTTGVTVSAADFAISSTQGKDYTTAATVSGITISLR